MTFSSSLQDALEEARIRAAAEITDEDIANIRSVELPELQAFIDAKNIINHKQTIRKIRRTRDQSDRRRKN
ncbi:MAG: hypothetical protein QNJ54_16155 [Prochloraceae cyanobacterium]|nr:hypothetical protein [Prochloraceae cyanobacterium]